MLSNNRVIFKNIGEKRRVGKLAFNWCIANLRKSKFHEGYPRFIMKSDAGSHKGYYKHSKNVICIYLGNHKDQKDLIETIIHEWKHYQQNIKVMYRKYITVYRRNNSNHPYEITATKFSKKKSIICNEWIKEQII